MTTEAARLANQRFCLEKMRQEGFADADNKMRWPNDAEGRSKMGRALFGFALTNELDTTFEMWRDRVENAQEARAGEDEDGDDDEWRERFAGFSGEQRQVVLDVVDDLLHWVFFRVGVTFDQFDFGQLSIQLTADANDDDDGDEFTVEIHPEGSILDMHDEVPGWEERFGRNEEIGRRR